MRSNLANFQKVCFGVTALIALGCAHQDRQKKDTESVHLSRIVPSKINHKAELNEKLLSLETTWSFEKCVFPKNEVILKSDDLPNSLKVSAIYIDEVKKEFIFNKNNQTFSVKVDSAYSSCEVRAQYSFSLDAGSIVVTRLREILRIPPVIRNGDSLEYELTPKIGFDYSDPVRHSLQLSGANGFEIISSGPVVADKTGVHVDTSPVGAFVLVIADAKVWQRSKFKINDATIELLTPRKNSFVEEKDLKSCLDLLWLKWTTKFGTPTDYLAFVDSDFAPVSGGPFGNNVLALFAQEKISKDDQAFIQHALGWKPSASTREYISREYKAAKNPWIDYLTGMISHELGHLYFGFGKTTERPKDANALWFSLGLGVLYDMQITQEVTGRLPELLVASERVWLRYSKIPEIDQHLINPNTENDPKFNLARKQVYAHSKAAFVLGKIREAVGSKVFDDTVAEYLKLGLMEPLGYAAFRKLLLPKFPDLPRVEEELQI